MGCNDATVKSLQKNIVGITLGKLILNSNNNNNNDINNNTSNNNSNINSNEIIMMMMMIEPRNTKPNKKQEILLMKYVKRVYLTILTLFPQKIQKILQEFKIFCPFVIICLSCSVHKE